MMNNEMVGTNTSKRSGFALFSFVAAPLGILSIVHVALTWNFGVRPENAPSIWKLLGIALTILSPAAVVIGIIALITIRKHLFTLYGVNYAVAGIVLGLLSSFLVFSELPGLNQRGPFMSGALLDKCIVNLKKLNNAARLYSQDHDGCFPPAKSWNTALAPYIDKKYLICPAAENQDVPSYSMNSNLGGVKYSPDDHSVLFFESESGRNKSGTKVMHGTKIRHQFGRYCCFVDGSVRPMHSLNIE